jgi:HAD superfamily hydrolase (TIGR01484 family)
MPSSDAASPKMSDHTNNRMRPLANMSGASRLGVQTLFTDIDDTLTTEGRLTAAAYTSLEQLQTAGIRVILVTGRPAGWCDHMARMWPVDGVVGENGAFCFRYDHEKCTMDRHYIKSATARQVDRVRLDQLAAHILAEVPGCAIANDQAYRDADLAIDFCEDVAPLPQEAVRRIFDLFFEAGAVAKISSIHVNGWFGSWDKLSMARIMMQRYFDEDLDITLNTCIYAGDSPNDAPMFSWFPMSVGVANVADFALADEDQPAFVTKARAGAGFTELVGFLLKDR